MADNTEVNSQITDAVTQTNVKVLGEAPAQAMGTLYQIASQAAGIAI
ncbi:MAG: RebB family R body protein, partial [Dinoroseobacter sp.]|nr:RebB family R body protein [Dinoroseobacter sp.]